MTDKTHLTAAPVQQSDALCLAKRLLDFSADHNGYECVKASLMLIEQHMRITELGALQAVPQVTVSLERARTVLRIALTQRTLLDLDHAVEIAQRELEEATEHIDMSSSPAQPAPLAPLPPDFVEAYWRDRGQLPDL